MKYSGLVLLLVVGLIQVSCDKGVKTITTESGMALNFYEKGEVTGFTDGDIVILNLKIETEDGRIIIDSEADGDPKPIMYNAEQWAKEGLFYEALSECGLGDSLTFQVSANDFFLKTFRSPVPDSIEGASNLKMTVGIQNAMNMEDYNGMMAERQTNIESNTIEEFLAENNMVAQKTESGLRYVITQEGTGEKPQSGDMVQVHYRGTLLDDTEFDSSIGKDPLEFALGVGRVIKGWDEGIALLNVGSKATLVIPSALGYGPRGAGGRIPPNAILKFEVELVGVNNN